MAGSISSLASRYRRERVALDHLRQTFDANEDIALADTLEASMLAAFGRCQATARGIEAMAPATLDDRLERAAVLLDAGLLADEPIRKLRAILSDLEAASPASTHSNLQAVTSDVGALQTAIC